MEGKLAAIIGEAWCDRNWYIWHWYVSGTGTKNYSIMLINSSLMNEVLAGVIQLRTRISHKLQTMRFCKHANNALLSGLQDIFRLDDVRQTDLPTIFGSRSEVHTVAEGNKKEHREML